MGDFAEVAEQALPAGNDSPETPAVPADSGSSPTAPAVPDSPTTPATGPITPAQEPAPSPTPPAAAGTATVTAPADTGKMVPAQALKEARDQNRALRSTYEWLPREHAPALREFWQHYQREPVQAIVAQLQQMLQHPVYSQQIRALMGTGAENQEPGPDWQDQETGERTYSPAQLAKWQHWKSRQDQSAFDAKLQPLQHYVQQQQQREKLGEFQQQAVARAKEIFGPLRQDPDFVQHEAAIKDRYHQHVEAGMGGEAALYRAYNEVIREAVVPSLRRSATTSVVAALNQKPGASSPNPARPGGATTATQKPQSFREAAEALLS